MGEKREGIYKGIGFWGGIWEEGELLEMGMGNPEELKGIW